MSVASCNVFEFLSINATCLSCPVNAISTVNGATCQCLSGYYAIEDIELFLEVDPNAYEDYINVYVDLASEDWPNPHFDPNTHLEFWCAQCPEGAECSVPGATLLNITATEGFYLGLDGTGTEFFPCLNDACKAESTCFAGYTGNACVECEEGLVRTPSLDFECSTCPSSFGTVLSFLIMVLLFGLCFIYIFFRKKARFRVASRELNFVLAKIIISTWQVNSMALIFAFKWDHILTLYFAFQSRLSSLGLAYLDLSCLVRPSPQDDLVLQTLIPALLPIISILLVFLIAVWRAGLAAGGLTRHRKNQVKSKVTALAVLLGLLTQPYLVARFAVLFSCVRMGKTSADLYLVRDVAIQCWSSTHWSYMFGLGLPMFVLYVVGAPLAVYRISTQRDTQLKLTRISTWLGVHLGSDPSHDPNSWLSTERDTVYKAVLADRCDQQRVKQSKKLTLDKSVTRLQQNYDLLFQGYHPAQAYWEVKFNFITLPFISLSLALYTHTHNQPVIFNNILSSHFLSKYNYCN